MLKSPPIQTADHHVQPTAWTTSFTRAGLTVLFWINTIGFLGAANGGVQNGFAPVSGFLIATWVSLTICLAGLYAGDR